MIVYVTGEEAGFPGPVEGEGHWWDGEVFRIQSMKVGEGFGWLAEMAPQGAKALKNFFFLSGSGKTLGTEEEAVADAKRFLAGALRNVADALEKGVIEAKGE